MSGNRGVAKREDEEEAGVRVLHQPLAGSRGGGSRYINPEREGFSSDTVDMLSRLLILLLAAAIAHGYRFRQKRVSDQRLAELETLVALSNMKGNIKTIPYGYGSVDPYKAGRKRRSSGALIDRLIQSIAHEDDDSTGQERPVIQWPPYFWAANDQPE